MPLGRVYTSTTPHVTLTLAPILTQFPNLINHFLSHSLPVSRISWKFARYFVSYSANKQTDGQTNGGQRPTAVPVAEVTRTHTSAKNKSNHHIRNKSPILVQEILGFHWRWAVYDTIRQVLFTFKSWRKGQRNLAHGTNNEQIRKN